MAAMARDPDAFLHGRDFARMARAIRFIDERFREQPRLAAVAAHVGLSEFHFNRLFRRWAGVTPKQYLTHVTGVAARAALAAEPSVLEAAHAVGLSGPGRLHDLVVTLDAMTPGEVKSGGAGVRIRHGLTRTPFGTAQVAMTPRGLLALSFVDIGMEALAERGLKAAWPRAEFVADGQAARALACRLWDDRPGGGEPLRLAVAGTNFQLRVWEALLALGTRAPTSYSALACSLRLPEHARAVANAVGANPIAWVIPCHRVLRKSGLPGGYRWGVERKVAMLAWEVLASARAPHSDAAVPHKLTARRSMSTAERMT
jgi:AraC family transcriptional regulator of adaptative response/methylated-DNA-[protein]-cysteine methyltransferase